jgi:hypothetical protein
MRLTIQVWRDNPRQNGEVPIRIVLNHPELADPDDPSGAGFMVNCEAHVQVPSERDQQDGRNLDRRLTEPDL